MSYRIFLMNCLLVVLLVSACKSTAETGEPDETIQPLMSESQMPAPDDEPRSTEEDGELGTVRYLELEGGFYGIVIDSGAKYLPLNLDEAFQQDSMRVRVKVRPRKDVMTIAMWGQPVDVVQIKKADD